MKKNILLTLLSVFISLLVIEIFFQTIFSYKDKYRYGEAEARYMLFYEPNGEIFDVYDNFFKYKANKTIHAETFFEINKNFKKEYSYSFKTNNFGLVQEKDLEKSKKSILLLGASFVEGQGAKPWVNNLKLINEQFQLINGGILGTGPQQMENLEKHISIDFKIDKLLFFYLGGEFRRDPFSIPLNTITCLKNYLNCEGNENFYGFPFKEKNPYEFLLFLENYRLMSFKNIDKFKYYRRLVKNKISNLYIFKIPTNFLKNSFYKTKNKKIIKNISSVDNLINKYNKNIYFIQLNTKQQIGFGKTYETLFAEDFLLKKNVNHFYCDFDNDINNFHPNDGHPNKYGYESLRNCVQEILDQILTEIK